MQVSHAMPKQEDLEEFSAIRTKHAASSATVSVIVDIPVLTDCCSARSIAACRFCATSEVCWKALRQLASKCREALLCQAGGPEEFLAIRANYAASLAAVSVTGYITGAGDRHLENFLLHTASGTLIPIDFGCATHLVALPSWPLHYTRLPRDDFETS